MSILNLDDNLSVSVPLAGFQGDPPITGKQHDIYHIACNVSLSILDLGDNLSVSVLLVGFQGDPPITGKQQDIYHIANNVSLSILNLGDNLCFCTTSRISRRYTNHW